MRSIHPLVVACRFILPCGWLLLTTSARADNSALGAPPADATALVTAPKATEDVPTWTAPAVTTNATISAGGQATTGNSNMLAATVNGKFDTRRGADAFGASLLGNYGQSAPPSNPEQGHEYVTTQNVQGRIRYDRYFSDSFAGFFMVTGRNDRFQGLVFRLNLDPGIKGVFFKTPETSLWGELGYDYQFDWRLDSASYDMGLYRKVADHSARAFLGFKHSFNKHVTFTTGAEFLQGFVKSTLANLDYDSRLNYDALVAADMGGGLSLGAGFSARWDSRPLPGKAQTDTSTTLSLIYAFATQPPAPPPPPAPPCAPAPVAARPPSP
ncbi:MAG: DUF481 domain-containing protein [Polyangiaceae bacterium]|jgi:putative salt-induced outer membrane protein YdiY